MQMTIAIEPIPQALTANERRVKALLDQSKTIFQIAYKLHMSFEAVRDAIFEIRKKESIMGHRLTQEEKERIIELAAAGVSVKDLAGRFCNCQQTIRNVLNGAKKAEDITEDDAPMLDDEEAEPELQQISAMPGMPRCVWAALDDRISSINLEIETREQRIGELREEIAVLAEEHDKITEWMEAHE